MKKLFVVLLIVLCLAFLGIGVSAENWDCSDVDRCPQCSMCHNRNGRLCDRIRQCEVKRK